MASEPLTRDMPGLINRLKRADRIFSVVGFLSTLVGVVVVFILLGALIYLGLPVLNWKFLSSMPSMNAKDAGILEALVGSLLVISVTVVIAVPLGIAAAVYLEEYARRNWFTTLVEINISNLAGVPSIVYGLMSAGLIVYQLKLGKSVLAAGITLGLLVLPVIIVATREALRTVPNSIREAAFAMGATPWQVVWYHLLPYSAGGIATGVIIAVSRALGETAPLIVIGMYLSSKLPAPPFLFSKYVVLPFLMYDWVQRPTMDFQALAAAAGLVLIGLTFALNAVAMYVRYHARKRVKW